MTESKNKFNLSTTEEIIDDAKNGKMYILVDDPDRENEGDLIIPGQYANSDAINFMAKYGRGLICLAMTKNRIEELNLPLMNPNNQKNDLTAFTVSIEAKEGVTTGISAADRAHTISVAINNSKNKYDLVYPGHVFPLMAWDGGVLERAGHTEAAVDISKLANLNPSGVICEIMNDDGSMARLPEIITFAKKHNLKVGTVSDLIKFKLKKTKIVKLISERPFESEMGSGFSLKIFQNTISGENHYALVKNLNNIEEPFLVRMHKLNITKDIFEEKNIFGSEIKSAFQLIEKSGSGAIVLINSDMAPNILKTFNKRSKTKNKLELREYGVGAQILSLLNIKKIILLTNSKKRIIALDGFNLEIIDQHKI
tara:strand:+ start:3026 stop:4129 length:1104 start_codon:yes stop_codon:yes gene_type:complete